MEFLLEAAALRLSLAFVAVPLSLITRYCRLVSYPVDALAVKHMLASGPAPGRYLNWHPFVFFDAVPRDSPPNS